jgi:hypothetical protein
MIFGNKTSIPVWKELLENHGQKIGGTDLPVWVNKVNMVNQQAREFYSKSNNFFPGRN